MHLYTTVKGMKRTLNYLKGVRRDLGGQPIVAGMRRATMIVTRDARKYAPSDLGHLRRSITPHIEIGGWLTRTVRGVVGSPLKYAPPQELGARPHWPPLGAIAPWAKRHGMSAWSVAAAIAVKGTKPVRYLQRALVDNAPQIYKILGNVVAKIIRR